MSFVVEKWVVWIVAAAAGAGFVAQHWKDLFSGKMRFSDLSHRKTGNSRQKCILPFRAVVGEKCILPFRAVVGEGSYRARELACEDTMIGLSGNLGMLDNWGSCNYTTGSPDDKNLNVDRGRARVGDEINVGEGDFSYGLRRNKSSLRSKQTIGHLVKPLNSLDSCLLAQMYKEQAEMEEYFFRSFPSSAQMMRPFVVTDGSQINSRASSDEAFRGLKKLQKDVFLQENGLLPNIGSLGKAKANRGKDHSGSFSRKANESSHGAFLVCLGISVGIFSSFFAHKKEVDELNGLLKQTENLVQDLQEELEMRDSLTVKELATEDYESQDTHNSSYNKELLHVFPLEKKLKHRQHSEGESISKIEAELEAELERLELNMNSFQLEEDYSELEELDPAFVPDLAEGELRADVFNRRTDRQPYADQDGSGNSTPRSTNYAVSPRELSLRLHQTLQSQLEERVRELEMALEHSQRKVRNMEAQLSSNHWKDNPVVINLAGDAYNDGFEELSRMNESEVDIAPGIGTIEHQDDRDVNWIGNSRFSDDESDEIEKLLIKHILEKARKGSPAVLNAQRALFSPDESEH